MIGRALKGVVIAVVVLSLLSAIMASVLGLVVLVSFLVITSLLLAA